MKKFLAIILAVVLMLSLSVVALAADGNPPTFTKSYQLEEGKYTDNSKSPAETFKFSDPECKSVENAGTVITENEDGTTTSAVVTASTAPLITIGTITDGTASQSVAFDAGAATAEGAKKTININLPEYEAVGIYTYTFKEEAGNSAGVTYFPNEITVVVTVSQEYDDAGKPTGFVKVTAVHCESSLQPVYLDENGNKVDANGAPIDEVKKTDTFVNTYASGDLSVKKTVAGNMGDKSKDWHIVITLTAPSGKKVRSTVTYSVAGGDPQTADFNDNGIATINATLKHDQTVSILNIPDGVSYSVTETEADQNQYKTTYTDSEGNTASTEGDIAAGKLTQLVVVNTKETNPDTGITLDSLPYILIGMVVLAAAVAMILNKRRNNAF